jgi:dolichyl-phosphate beta-glucosyltransferase
MLNKTVLIVPCFNEQLRLSDFYFTELQTKLKCDLLFIDDGSTDKTYEMLLDAGPNSTVIKLNENVGKTKAIAFGMNMVKFDYDWVGVCDADGAVSVQDWIQAIQIAHSLPEIDLISGARVLLAGMPISRNTGRKWIGRIVATGVSLIVQRQIYDPQSPCKIYHAKYLRKIDFAEFRTRWFFDAEMLLQSNSKANIKEFMLSNWRDVPGSHLGISSIFEVIADLIKLLLSRFFSLRKKRV